MATYSRRRATRSLFALPIIAGLAFSMTACSGSSEPPTQEKLAQGLAKVWDGPTIPEEQRDAVKQMMTPEVNDCMAGEFLKSDLSAKTLNLLADGKDLSTKDDATALQTVLADSLMTCATAAQ